MDGFQGIDVFVEMLPSYCRWRDTATPVKLLQSDSNRYNHVAMTVTVRSFAKINVGLCIGGIRPDGFHELRTVYQTIALHDILRVRVARGSGIEIVCTDPRVPVDNSNTCYRMAERALDQLKIHRGVKIEIEKKLPVQGGLGGASSNAVAVLLALQIAVKKTLPSCVKLRMASEVGSDVPLFLVGGTVLGCGRGEEIYPLTDFSKTACIIATPAVSVSTPRAFADWDLRIAKSKLTGSASPDRISGVSRTISSWLSGSSDGGLLSGVPAKKGGGRAETPLLDLVRTGIENDFEKVVFAKYPKLREVKSVLIDSGAFYASLSGSGSAVYGMFDSMSACKKGMAKLNKIGVCGTVTTTLPRREYWKKFLVSGS